jgi:hypothetical protein
MTVLAKHIEHWPPNALIPYSRNARTHSAAQIEQIAQSIRTFGFTNPILVDGAKGILAGHGRLKAALKLELAAVPVIVLDHLTEAERRAYILADNKLAENAGWDDEILAAELREIQAMDFDLAVTGFDDAELRKLLGEADDPAADECPAVPERALTVAGDLWLLGRHRLLCGDSTNGDDAARLFGSEKPDLCVTDPPYGIDVVKVSGEGQKGVVGGANIVRPKMYAPIINDEGTGTAQQFYSCARQSGIDNFIIFGGNYFTDFLPPSACWVIWDKQNSGNFADVEMAWTSFNKGAKLYSWMWNGLSREGDRKSELDTRVHPTQKPVGLFQRIFADFPCSCCYDGFLGSGSTLIACEKTDRVCFGMELSPAYCHVIVKRWQTYTGKQATRESDGRLFDELEREALCPQ